jgi:hypothetical protein
MEKQIKTEVKKTTPAKKAVAKVQPQTVSKIVSNTISEVKAELVEAQDEFKEVFTNAVEEISETLDVTLNVEQNLNKLKDLNAQISKTAGEIVNEVKEMSNEIKEVALKGFSEINKKADLNENLELVKASANEVKVIVQKNATKFQKTATKKVNAIVADLTGNFEEIKQNSTKKADEFLTEMTDNALEMRETATKLAKDAIENIKINERIATAKLAFNNANEYALTTTSNLIETAEANGLKWQNVQRKAVDSSMVLVKNQEEIFFTTLETIKTQVNSSKNRFKKIFA